MQGARMFLCVAVLGCTCLVLYSVLEMYSPQQRAAAMQGMERDLERAHGIALRAEQTAESRARAVEMQLEASANHQLAGLKTGAALSTQTMLLVALVVTISAAGGIGGGGVLVPVLMLSEELGPHGAIPLSKLTIFGNAVCQLALNWRKSHAMRPERPLIDYDTTLMLEPPTLLGTVIGVLLNRMTPKWLIALLLLAFLTITTWRTSSKAFKLYGKESAVLASRAALTPRALAKHREDENSKEARIAEARQGQPIQIPWPIIRQLALVWLLILSASIARRRAGCGTAAYWVVLLGLGAAVAVTTRKTAHNFLARHTARVAAHYEYCEGDVVWDEFNVVRLPLGCVVAGVMAGMLGVGGGMVMQPLMLEIGLLPVCDLSCILAVFICSRYAVVKLAADAAWYVGRRRSDCGVHDAVHGLIHHAAVHAAWHG